MRRAYPGPSPRSATNASPGATPPALLRARLGRDARGGAGAAGELGEAHRPDVPHGLEDDPPGHLRAADAPVCEHDRHLRDTEAALQRAEGELDLEGVAGRGDRPELEGLEHLAPEALKAAGQVPDRD